MDVRREYERGRVISVDLIALGDTLAADAAAAATTIFVDDAADFDEDGGQLLIEGTVYTYTAVDDDTGEITLATGLAAAAEEGDEVAVYDPLYLVAATEKVAQVEVIGDDGNVDTLEATIAMHLIDRLDEGIRGNDAERVKCELDGDEWVVVDLLGMSDPTASGVQFFQDSLTVTDLGDQAITLTHEPIPHSEHLYWNGLYQPGTEWTRDEKVVSIADPGSVIEVDDQLVVEYAYRVGFLAEAADDYAASSDIPLTIPGTPGAFLVAAVMVQSGNTYSANGFTATESAAVTHDVGGASVTLKFVVFTGAIDQSGTLPTVTNVAGDQSWAAAVLHGISAASVTVGTVADDTTANTPASTAGRNIRVWAAIAEEPHIDTTSVTVQTENNPPHAPGANVDLVIALSDDIDDGATRTATSPVSAGWLLATVEIS